MMDLQLLQAGLMLGGFIFLAGCYGLLFGMGRLWRMPAVTAAGYVCYALQCLLAAFIIATTPFEEAWKVVIVICTVGFLGIPHVTLFFLERTHGHEEA
jgi:hypothetical protein